MSNRQDADRAQQISAATIRLMQQQDVPPTPQNYMVWYSFLSDSEPELKRLMLPHVQSPDWDSKRVTQTLYEAFFSRDEEHRILENANDAVSEAASDLSEHLTNAHDKYQTYQDGISDMLDNLKDQLVDKQSESLPSVLEHLIRQSVRIQAVNSRLMDHIASVGEEMDELRETLKSAQKDSLTDSLTSIPNRRRFDQFLRLCVETPGGQTQPLSVIFTDVDHFKSFNDEHGHKMGDQVLKLVAGELTRFTKSTDLAARIGGEEFALILPGISAEEAYERAERIRTTISARQLRNKVTGDLIGQVTLSLGVTTWHAADTLDSFIERADAALYQAKSRGRNRTELTEKENAQATA